MCYQGLGVGDAAAGSAQHALEDPRQLSQSECVVELARRRQHLRAHPVPQVHRHVGQVGDDSQEQ